jgi:PIN domain nuclease of toxin-antitoxin system
MERRVIHLDTHVVVWLYAGEIDRLPKPVRASMEANGLCISPAVVLELRYLREVGKITADAPMMLQTLSASIGLTVADTSFIEVVMAALPEACTRDPFDRLIVANAKVEQARLLSKDESIRRHYADAFWG